MLFIPSLLILYIDRWLKHSHGINNHATKAQYLQPSATECNASKYYFTTSVYCLNHTTTIDTTSRLLPVAPRANTAKKHFSRKLYENKVEKANHLCCMSAEPARSRSYALCNLNLCNLNPRVSLPREASALLRMIKLPPSWST